MNENKQKNNFILIAIIFIAVGSIMRLLPHPANFAPIAALALFGGVYLRRSYAIFLPVAALALSDLFLPSYSWPMRLAVYSSFAIVGLIGFWLRKHRRWFFVVGGSLAGSVIFYLITNAGVWAFTNYYSPDFSGLMQSYYYALPFFRNTIAGDLFYVGVFFGSYEAVKILVHKWQKNQEMMATKS